MSKFFVDDEQRDKNKKALWKGAAPNARDFVSMNSSAFDSQGSISAKTGEAAADTEVNNVGPKAGEAAVPTVGDAPATQGIITNDGSRITVSGEMGQESIDIRHHNGAHVVLRPDGAVYMYATGKKGFGMVAAKGDGTISAKGRLILDADDLIIQSKGDIQFRSGGSTRFYSEGDYQTVVSGSVSHEIEGDLINRVVKDIFSTSGGATRNVSAGPYWVQTPATFRTDSKVANMRTTENIELDAGKAMSLKATEDADISTTGGSMTILSKGTATLASKEGMATIVGQASVAIDSENTINLRGKNYVNIDTKEASIDSETNIEMKTSEMKLHGTTSIYQTATTMVLQAAGRLETISGGTTKMGAAAMDIDSSGGIDMRGSTIDFNKAAADAATPQSPQTPMNSGPRTAPGPEAPAAAKFKDGKTIIGEMTSTTMAPDFPYNAMKMSANEFSTLENEGVTPSEQAGSIARQNTPSGSSRPTAGDSYGEITASSEYNTTTSEESPHPSPNTTEVLGEWLSKNVTMGAFKGMKWIPGKGQDGVEKAEIISNIKHLCHNILDPLIDQFGSDVYISSGFRMRHGSGDSNHFIGKAVDVRAANRSDHAKTAEMAKYVVENLPYAAVFLEKNNEGGIHVHLEAAPAGSGAAGPDKVKTCTDPKCRSSKPGLHLEFAVKALQSSKR